MEGNVPEIIQPEGVIDNKNDGGKIKCSQEVIKWLHC
jgi:hypothetical protein